MSHLKEKTIGVLCGGFSNEREISLRSGKNIYDALIRLGYKAKLIDPATEVNWLKGYDIAFIILHGTFGEDGSVQSILDQAKIPYVGSGSAASIRGFNKYITKIVLKENQLPVAPFVLEGKALYHLPAEFSYPVITKPIKEGSSVGVAISDNDEQLYEHTKHLETCFGYYLLEPFYENKKEITVGVIENPEPIALPVLELRPKNRFYDYDAKYTKGKTEFILPASLTEEETKKVKELAVKTHIAMGCRGFSRVDMLVEKEKGPVIIEINTLPGFTDTSDLPAQAKEAGISFDELVETVLKTAK